MPKLKLLFDTRTLVILKYIAGFQAGVWQNLLNKGIDDVIQPAAFKLAIVLRHTPSDLTVRLLTDLLHLHPQSVSTLTTKYPLNSVR